MLIGFDDTGTVVENEKFMVAVVFIQPSALPALSHAFERWKELTRRTLPDRPAEIKSSDMRSEHYKSFVNKVLFANGVTFFYTAYGIHVDERVLYWAELQKKKYIDQYTHAITEAARAGRAKWSRQAETLRGWIRSTPPGMMIKMSVLNEALCSSVNQAVGTSAVNDFDDELGQLRFFIDMGFLKDGSVHFWQEILRSNIIQHSQEDPFISLEGWDDSHPFKAEFVEEEVGPYVRFKREFIHRIAFYDSRESTEVQVADIIAGLMRRKYINHWQAPYLERMKQFTMQNELTLFDLSDISKFAIEDSPEPNIYEEFRRLKEGG